MPRLVRLASENVAARIRRLAPDGVDAVFDHVGGRGVVDSWHLLAPGGTLVSYGGLGNLISDGVQNNFKAEILAASVLCVVLAVVLDAVIVGVQWVATPWTHRGRSA